MPALTVLWILFLLVTIYDNQTELLLQTKLQLQIKKKKHIWATAQGKAIPLTLTGFWEGEVGHWEEERASCLLNSEIPSRERPSLASVAQNFDSSFHLVSIRRGNLANGWPRNCSTCTSWPWAPVKGAKENEEISPGPFVQSSAGKVALERNRELFHLAGQVQTKLTIWLHSKVTKPSVMGRQVF